MTGKRLARAGLGLAVSALFLWLFLRGLQPRQLLATLRSLHWGYLVPAALVYYLAIWVRTWRWGLVLGPIRRVPTRRLYPIYMISYMANNILPLRMGDIYRAYVTGRQEQVSAAATLTTIVVERAFDGLTMLGYLVVVGALFSPFEGGVQEVIRYGAIGFGLAVAVLYAALWQRRLAIAVLDRLLGLLPAGAAERGRRTFCALLDGLEVLRGGRAVALIAAGSLATWLIEAVMFWIVFAAFDLALPLPVALATMAVVNLGIIIPAGPGYVGTFEAFCALILGVYGVQPGVAAAYALVVHATQWIPSTLAGLVFMWTRHISFSEIQAAPGPVPACPASGGDAAGAMRR